MNNWNGTLQELELVCFDIDGTLTESKSPIDKEMSDLLCKLLDTKKVAVVSGGSFNQFKNQFLSHFVCSEKEYENLYLIPTNGGLFYQYIDNGWKCLYEKMLSDEDKKRIFEAFEKAFEETGFIKPEHIYGPLIEDRESQVTFSAFGNLAPLAVKKDWDLDHKKREKIVASLNKYIPDFSVRIGGTSSIDITLPGVDKAYGLQYLMKLAGISSKQVLYVGDALFPGGNDSSVIRLGINTKEVEDLSATKKFVANLVSI